jgi:hypothetical protein
MLKSIEKIRNIIEGFKYTRVEDPVRESIAASRAEICAECPDAKMGRIFGWKEDRLKEIEGLSCGVCGCGLSEKLRSKSELCPKGKWGDERILE